MTIDADDGIRPGTTPASLAQLKPVFKKGGSTTAGNSSQVCCNWDWGCLSGLRVEGCASTWDSRQVGMHGVSGVLAHAAGQLPSRCLQRNTDRH